MVGPEWGDGMFCPGGSMGNGTALNLARFNFCPDVKVSESCINYFLIASTVDEVARILACSSTLQVNPGRHLRR